MTIQAYFDYKNDSFLYIIFTPSQSQKSFQSSSHSFLEELEVDEELTKHQPFFYLPKNYENMWDKKSIDECINTYDIAAKKVEKHYKYSA